MFHEFISATQLDIKRMRPKSSKANNLHWLQPDLQYCGHWTILSVTQAKVLGPNRRINCKSEHCSNKTRMSASVMHDPALQ